MHPFRTVVVLAVLQSAFIAPVYAAKSAAKRAGATTVRSERTSASSFSFLDFGLSMTRALLTLGDEGGSGSHASKSAVGAKPSRYSNDYEPVRKVPYKALSTKARAPIAKLFEQETRPDIAQVMSAVRAAHGGKLPAENPFGDAERAAGSADAIADTIAQLERAYPGATYYPVGRDAALIGDALQAFYRSIGQPNRVQRLDISHPSFPNYHGSVTPVSAERDRPLLDSFLKSNGIDVEKLGSGPMHVMIDATPYQYASQSRQLMRAAFQTAAQKGIAPQKLYDRLAFVGLPGGGGYRLGDSIEKLNAGKAQLKLSTTKDGPDDIFYLDTDINKLSYTGFWHEMFETLEKDGKGGVVAMRGPATSTKERERAAAQLYEVGRIVESPEFVARVKSAAQKAYGYSFPLKRTDKLTIRSVTSAKGTEDARGVAKVRGSRGTQSLFTALERDLSDRGVNKADKSYEFLADLAGMWRKGTATDGDVATAVRMIEAHVSVGKGALKTRLSKDIYSKATYKGFQKVVERAADNSGDEG